MICGEIHNWKNTLITNIDLIFHADSQSERRENNIEENKVSASLSTPVEISVCFGSAVNTTISIAMPPPSSQIVVLPPEGVPLSTLPTNAETDDPFYDDWPYWNGSYASSNNSNCRGTLQASTSVNEVGCQVEPAAIQKMKNTRPKMKLSSADARVIYSFKDYKGERGNSASLAKRFGITKKAVHDVWSGRTWKAATSLPFKPSTSTKDIQSPIISGWT